MGDGHYRPRELVCKGRMGGGGSSITGAPPGWSTEPGEERSMTCGDIEGWGPDQKGPHVPHLEASSGSQTPEGFDRIRFCALSDHRAEKSLDRTHPKSERLVCGDSVGTPLRAAWPEGSLWGGGVGGQGAPRKSPRSGFGHISLLACLPRPFTEPFVSSRVPSEGMNDLASCSTS